MINRSRLGKRGWLGFQQPFGLQAVAAFPRTSQSIAISRRRPFALSQLDIVDRQQSPGPEMQVGQGLVVSNQAGVVGNLGLGTADLGPEQVIQCLGPGVEHLDLELADPFLGSGTSVEV